MIQVYDGIDDGLFSQLDLRDRIQQYIAGLVNDLENGSRWLPCGRTPVLIRLRFKVIINEWLVGTTTKEPLSGAVEDIQALVALYEKYSRPTTAQRLKALVSMVEDMKGLRSESRFVA